MTRQVFLRVLMSLVLLFSQQIATSHVMTHLSGPGAPAALPQPAAEGDDNTRAIAKDQSCNKCLVFAQFAAPLGSGALSYAPPEPASTPVDGAAIAAAHARTILAFQSRAPPQA